MQRDAFPLQTSSAWISGQQEDSLQCHGQGRYHCQWRRWGQAWRAPPETQARCGLMFGELTRILKALREG